MKRILASVLLCGLFATMFVGCGGDDSKPADASKPAAGAGGGAAGDAEKKPE